MGAIRIGGLALVVACVASAILPGSAGAQGKPASDDNTGFIGIPQYTSSETGIPFFSPTNASTVDRAIRALREAAANCDRVAYDLAVENFKGSASYPAFGGPQGSRDMENMWSAMDKFPPFPKACTDPSDIIRKAIDNFFHMYFVAGVNVPLGVNSAVTGVDTFFGAGAYQIDNRSSTSGNATAFAGMRARAQTAMWEPTITSPFQSLSAFVETGIQTAFGAQSSLQTFQNVSGTPQAFGSNTISENLQIPILVGVTAPIVPGSAGKPAVLFDLYGGITLDSWTQTLQGRESGAPGGPGFFGQNRRFTVDPTVGVGVRVPVGDVGGLPGLTVGVNAELQFRPGGVVTAPSANFPSETYYGTVNPTAHMAIMARIGIPFGGR